MARFNSCRTCDNAPTSSHVTSGTVANPSRCADGWTNFRALLKSYKVIEMDFKFS